jgi:hypothetical protein
MSVAARSDGKRAAYESPDFFVLAILTEVDGVGEDGELSSFWLKRRK